MKLVSYEEIKAALTLDDTLVKAVEAAYRDYSTGRSITPGVMHLELPERNGAFHIKSGYVKGKRFCVAKVASTFFDNPRRGLPSISSVHLAFSVEDGTALAVLDDRGWITNLRTAAAGAVAAKYLANKNVRTLAIVGFGVQGRLQLEAMMRYTNAAQVLVYRRDPGKLARAVEEVQAAHPQWHIAAAPSVEEAVRAADVVVAATSSTAPVIRAEWLNPGVLLYGMGADSEAKEEFDTATLTERADLVVVDSIRQNVALAEIGKAIRAGLCGADVIDAELGEIIAGSKEGRTSDDQIVVCKSTGVAVQDLAACEIVLQRVGILTEG